jgi:translation elongation factor EF-1beta
MALILVLWDGHTRIAQMPPKKICIIKDNGSIAFGLHKLLATFVVRNRSSKK